MTTGSALWCRLAAVDQLEVGQGRCFVIGNHRIALFRTRRGEFHALAAACPHRDGPLVDGVVGDYQVVCPLHGYRFDLRDGRGIDNDFATRSYAVVVRDGALFVQICAVQTSAAPPADHRAP